MPKPVFHCSTITLKLSSVLAATALSLGCTSPRETWQSLKGEGFPGWNERFGSGIRASKDAKPSGFFTDKKSEQIEKDLGGF